MVSVLCCVLQEEELRHRAGRPRRGEMVFSASSLEMGWTCQLSSKLCLFTFWGSIYFASLLWNRDSEKGKVFDHSHCFHVDFPLASQLPGLAPVAVRALTGTWGHHQRAPLLQDPDPVAAAGKRKGFRWGNLDAGRVLPQLSTAPSSNTGMGSLSHLPPASLAWSWCVQVQWRLNSKGLQHWLGLFASEPNIF